MNEYDIICFTETWLNSSVQSEELFDDRYVVYRRDRESTNSVSREGGGVLAAVSKKIISSRKSEWESDGEDLWLVINSSAHTNTHIFICIVYVPPKLDINAYSDRMQKVHDVFLQRSTFGSQFLIIGDFNLPEIKWLPDNTFDNKVSTPSNVLSFKAHSLVNLLSICNFYQFNYVLNQNNNILDLVLSDTINVEIHPASGLAKVDHHHPPIEIILNLIKLQYLENNNSLIKYNFKNGDYEGCRNDLLSINWISIFRNLNVNDMVNLFYEKIWESIDNNIKRVRKKSKRQYPAWFNLSLIKLLKEKNRVRIRARKYNNPVDHAEFSILRRRSKKEQKECYRSYINSIEAGLHENIRVFWSYSKSLSKSNHIPKQMHLDGLSASDGENIANLFSKYFSSVYTPSGVTQLSSVPSVTNEINPYSLSKIKISVNEIQQSLKKVDSGKGPGPDRVPPLFISRCAEALVLPLYIIYNESLSKGLFPKLWKEAHIVPVYKSGEQSSVKNYRPISILSCFAKTFESMIYGYIFSHFKPILCTRQHGFVPNRSINSNLLEFSNYVSNAFNDRNQVDAIYTDFQKAFDKVNHSTLLKKLVQLGIHGELLDWLKSYLENRRQKVIINGYKSVPLIVTSGVPQGSNLGPLLFLIFVNDLGPLLKCDYVLFADDLKMYRRIVSDSDHLMLQGDLNILNNWCTLNEMFLNVKKCYIMSFTRNRIKKNFSYCIGSTNLEVIDSIRDLGVIMDSKFVFDLHISDIKNKSLKMMGFIHRICRPFRNPQSVITLYNSLVRSKLEYGAVIWDPHYVKYIDSVESVQKKFLRMLSFKCGLHGCLQSYDDRLRFFNFDTLLLRRQMSELICLYKIIHNCLDAPQCLNQISISVPSRHSLRSYSTFHLNSYNNNVAYYNPIARMCRLYNCVEDSDVDIFDNNLLPYKRRIHALLCND